jgi:hypothetical protein
MAAAPQDHRLSADLSGLEDVEGLGWRARLQKGSLLGNMASALYRMRRVPLNAVRSAAAARADGEAAPRRSRHRYRAVYLVPAGPGDWAPLEDTLRSIRHYEGDDAKIVVVDDGSLDCRAAAVHRRFPDVDVARRRIPSGGPPRNLPLILHGLRHALALYSFDVVVKMDTDALVTGVSPSAVAAEFFERNPRVGMAGTYGRRADGVAEVYEWDRWVLRHTERWSPASRAMMARGRAGGYDGRKIHGGVYAVSRAAIEALAGAGDLSWREPWWTPLGEDFWLSVLVLASGFGLGSLGGPGEPFAVASKFTPLSKETVLAEGKVAIHSVRRGRDGEDEAAMRAFFASARDHAHAGSPAAEDETDASAPPGR